MACALRVNEHMILDIAQHINLAAAVFVIACASAAAASAAAGSPACIGR